MRHLSEQERRSRVETFLRSVEAVSVVEEAVEPEIRTLSDNSAKVLIKTAIEPEASLLEIYQALGLHPAEGKTAVNDLLARGMVRRHRLVRKGRGGQPQILEVLDKGAAELAKRGITPAIQVLKGGCKHDRYGRWVGKWASRHANNHRYEWTAGGKTFDVVYEDEEGALHGVEICLTGSAKWNASQLLKAACVEGIADVTAACENKAFMKAITEQIKELDELGLWRGKIQAKLLADYLE